MSTLARIFIAVTVCPALGGVIGGDFGRTAAVAAKVNSGLLAAWEMTGVLVGVCLGLIFAMLATYCIIGCGGRLRGRAADPVLLTVGALAVAQLLVRRNDAGSWIASTVRSAAVLAWLLGFLFVILAIRYRPRVPAEVEYAVSQREEHGVTPGDEGTQMSEHANFEQAHWEDEDD